MMTPILGDLLVLIQSLSGHEQPEAVAGKALECTLDVLFESTGFALVRTPFGALRIAARRGLNPEGETGAREWCEPGRVIVHAIEEGRSQLLAADDNRLAKDMRFFMPGEDIRYFAVVPFFALGKSVGGMVLFLRQEPYKLLWEEVLPYIGATAGLALTQLRLKEMITTHGRLASLGRVAAGIAHELRNPLTVLGATLGTLRLDLQLGEGARKKLTRAQGAFDRMVKLIDGVSEFSKPRKATTEPVRLSDLVSTLLDLLGAEARSRNIAFSVRVRPPLLSARGDCGRLLEVFINLVENAMDAIGLDGRIALEAEQASDKVRISVRDSGPGVPPDLLDRIFDPFFTTKANGTGLGLAIVREIVEELGGTISVESVVGAGTGFFVTLPSG